ncbi:MAG: FUSC family protein, partial [Gemmatimonadota bacterium]|nr:FUSC family protein [Gemmatimonadota bacterium]
VWGNSGVSVGGAALSVYVVALAIPALRATDALERAGYIVLGGIWAMGIALILWPLRPYRPVRIAIADAYTALAGYVDQLAADSEVRHTAEWPAVFTPTHSTSVRTALERATTILLQLRRGKPAAAERGERLLVLAESADQLFGHCVALGDTLSALRGEDRLDAIHDVVITQMREVALTARAVANTLLEEEGEGAIAVSWGGDAIRVSLRTQRIAASTLQYEHAAEILDRAAQFASVASATVQALNSDSAITPSVTRARAAEEPEEERSLWTTFRSVLSQDSLILRFALRVAVVTTIAVAITESLELKRGYWVTITVIVILQPYTGVTLTRAVQRVLGTVLGGLLAAALGAAFHDPRAILVIATIFVACCVALLPVNYAAFSVFLTPTFVLLAEASAGDWHLAGTRVVNTLLGGGLALVGARLLWPSPERNRFPTYAAAALQSNAAYLGGVIEQYDDHSESAGETMRRLRRAVGIATVNAEESLQRALTEAHGDRRALAPALTVLAYTRRFTASVAALAISRHSASAPMSAEMDGFRRDAVAVLGDISDALLEGRAPAPLPHFQPTAEMRVSAVVGARVERLSRQASTLHDAVTRITSPEVPQRGQGTFLAR